MKPKAKILVVEDEDAQRGQYTGYLSEEGFEVAPASSGEEAIEKLRADFYDLALLDLKLPGLDGIQVFSRMKEIQPDLQVIFISAYGEVQTVADAMKMGASDFLAKPIDLEELHLRMKGTLEKAFLLQENRVLKERLAERDRFHPSNIIYSSSKMEEVMGIVARVAESSSTVLIRGESGTGKELVASAIHYGSPRHERPFVKVNCSALPETLLESELFGHEKGSFTGALQRRIGRLEAANGGTLFLDEIGDLPPPVQIKLLRFLQEKVFERLGSNTPIPVDVRIIAATHRDLEKAVAEGRFRQDLYYRLQVIPIFIPPLRDRPEDIPILIEYFLRKVCEREHREPPSISPEARHFLQVSYRYPGNVRELENIVERAVVLSRRGIINLEDLPLAVRTGKPTEEAEEEQEEEGSMPSAVASLEKDMILQALDTSQGNQTQAAHSLGISERALRYKMKKYGIKGRQTKG